MCWSLCLSAKRKFSIRNEHNTIHMKIPKIKTTT